MQAELLFLLIVLLGSILSSTFGIGSGIIIIPIAASFFPMQYTISLCAVYFITGAISKLIVFRKYIVWEPVLYLWLGAIPAVIIGANLMAIVKTEVLEKILAIVIILYVISGFVNFKLKTTLKAMPIIGALYGFFAGIIGSGGVITAALFTSIGQTKEKFIASMALSAILINIIKVIIYARYNFLDVSQAPMFAGLAIAAFAGAFIGKYSVKKISNEIFRMVILIILLIISLKLLIL